MEGRLPMRAKGHSLYSGWTIFAVLIVLSAIAAAGLWGTRMALLENAGQGLEYAFDFMEAAFGNGQEMALFLTELNTGFYSVGFLQEYECERYYQYNQNLLFSEEERVIGRQIEKGMGKM